MFVHLPGEWQLLCLCMSLKLDAEIDSRAACAFSVWATLMSATSTRGNYITILTQQTRTYSRTQVGYRLFAARKPLTKHGLDVRATAVYSCGSSYTAWINLNSISCHDCCSNRMLQQLYLFVFATNQNNGKLIINSPNWLVAGGFFMTSARLFPVYSCQR